MKIRIRKMSTCKNKVDYYIIEEKTGWFGWSTVKEAEDVEYYSYADAVDDIEEIKRRRSHENV